MTLRKHIPRSNAKELGKIRVRKQNRNPNTSHRRKVVAIDTETNNGDIFLICVSDGKRLEYPNITFENAVKFLLRYEGCWVFLYNLQYDADCILKLLPKEVLKQYRVKKELKFEHNGYKIHYIDRKKLTISRGKHCVSCYDIMQYYDNMKLEKAYTKYIKKPLKPEYLEMKEKREDFSLLDLRQASSFYVWEGG